MWKSSEFCDFNTTWECDHDPNFLSTYTVVQQDENWEFPSNPDHSLSSSITFSRNEKNSASLEIDCSCKRHHSVSIIGIEVRSEVHTIELYSNMEGYLQTVRTKVAEEDGTFCCKAKLDKSVDSLNIKFMGLGQRSSVRINQLHFVVVQSLSKPGISDASSGMVDMAKVRGFLHSMGDSAPEGGTKLLHAVEDYQQTPMSQMGRLSSVLNAGSSDSSSVLTNLLAMVNKSHGTQQANQNTQNRSHDSELSNQNAINISNSTKDSDTEKPKPADAMAGGGALASMLMSMSRSQSECQGDSGGSGMFEMLQSICGKVSKLRVAEHSSETGAQNLPTETDSAKTSVENEPDIGASNVETSSRFTGLDLETLQSSVEQSVSKMLQASEDRITKYIDFRLNNIEAQLNQKLDTLIQLLQKPGHPLTEPGEETLSDMSAGV